MGGIVVEVKKYTNYILSLIGKINACLWFATTNSYIWAFNKKLISLQCMYTLCMYVLQCMYDGSFSENSYKYFRETL